MPPFSAVVPTPDTSGQFDLMGLPAGEDSVRKIKAVKPAAEIVAEMMVEAEEILRAELAAASESRLNSLGPLHPVTSAELVSHVTFRSPVPSYRRQSGGAT